MVVYAKEIGEEGGEEDAVGMFEGKLGFCRMGLIAWADSEIGGLFLVMILGVWNLRGCTYYTTRVYTLPI